MKIGKTLVDGKGANQAVSGEMLFYLTYFVGKDAHGKLIMDLCESGRVHIDHLANDDFETMKNIGIVLL